MYYVSVVLGSINAKINMVGESKNGVLILTSYYHHHPWKEKTGRREPYHTQVHVPFGGMRWVVNVFKAPPFPKVGWWGDDGY